MQPLENTYIGFMGCPRFRRQVLKNFLNLFPALFRRTRTFSIFLPHKYSYKQPSVFSNNNFDGKQRAEQKNVVGKRDRYHVSKPSGISGCHLQARHKYAPLYIYLSPILNGISHDTRCGTASAETKDNVPVWKAGHQ